MPLEITIVRKIINETDEPVTVYNLEKRQSVSLGARETKRSELDIPWMMSASDFTAPAPHLLKVHFDFTGNYVYFWQRDQYIMRGISLSQAVVAPDYARVMGGRDMIIADHGAFIFNQGTAPQKLWSGPATAQADNEVWGKGDPKT